MICKLRTSGLSVFILCDFRSVDTEAKQPHVHRQQHESRNNTQKTQEA